MATRTGPQGSEKKEYFDPFMFDKYVFLALLALVIVLALVPVVIEMTGVVVP